MKTLVIFNKITGQIISIQSGSGSQAGDGEITNLSIEVPDGKMVDKYDTVTSTIALKDTPKSEIEIQLLATQAQLANLQEQILLNNGGM